MKSIIEQRDVTERPPNSTTRIDNLPDEILIEIFDSYCRQYCQGLSFDEPAWEVKCWLGVSHVCRRWRAVMSASAFRLDLAISIEGPKKRSRYRAVLQDIEMILSGPWPILVDYWCKHEYPTDSYLKRMYSALEHHDRVRGIRLHGEAVWFDFFFKATNRPFPALEILYLRNRSLELKIPETFLGGPDLSNLRLRNLTLLGLSLTSISGLLSSATSLTDLSLELSSFGPSAGMSLLASLQGMRCLRNLDLVIRPPIPPSQPLVPKEVVLLSKLTRFRYHGSSVFLYAFVAAISAPSLQETNIVFSDAIQSPTVQVLRFIDEIEQQYQAVLVFIGEWLGSWNFSLSLETDLWNHELCLESGCDPRLFSESMMRMSGAFSARLSTLEVLRVRFCDRIHADYVWEDYLPWRRFYRHLSSVKTLQITYSLARTLYQDHGEPDDLFVLPALEEIHLFEAPTDESEREALLAAFQPFVNAREQAGRPVNVFFHEDLPM